MKGEGGHADQWATHLTDALVRFDYFDSTYLSNIQILDFLKLWISFLYFQDDLISTLALLEFYALLNSNSCPIFVFFSYICFQTHLLNPSKKRSRENRSKPPEGDLSRRPKPVLPKNLGTRVPVLTDFNPVELARQITIVGAISERKNQFQLSLSLSRYCLLSLFSFQC